MAARRCKALLASPPTLYFSSGAYAKVTQLIQPAGLCWSNITLSTTNRQAWFDGANLLRPKLRLKTPDDVRDFRRDVKAAEQRAG